MDRWSWLLWLAGALLIVAGAAVSLSALFADRARGRRRCPRCWYNMTGSGTLTCPECGRAARSERRLLRTRRHKRRAALGFLLLIAAGATRAVPLARERGLLGALPRPALSGVLFLSDTANLDVAQVYAIRHMSDVAAGRAAAWECRVLLDALLAAHERSLPTTVSDVTPWLGGATAPGAGPRALDAIGAVAVEAHFKAAGDGDPARLERALLSPSVPVRNAALRACESWCRDSAAAVLARAAKARAAAGDRSLMAALLKHGPAGRAATIFLAADPDPAVRRAAYADVYPCSAHDDPECFDALCALLASPADAPLRTHAASRIPSTCRARPDRHAAAVSSLRRALAEDPDRDTRVAAVRSLGWFGPGARPAVRDLAPLVYAADAGLSEAATEALERIVYPERVEPAGAAPTP